MTGLSRLQTSCDRYGLYLSMRASTDCPEHICPHFDFCTGDANNTNKKKVFIQKNKSVEANHGFVCRRDVTFCTNEMDLT